MALLSCARGAWQAERDWGVSVSETNVVASSSVLDKSNQKGIELEVL